jgi:hypothetical protein
METDTKQNTNHVSVPAEIEKEPASTPSENLTREEEHHDTVTGKGSKMYNK